MIIKKITIENYLCYFGSNDFELSSGLNIILGENGEGKTKFFEAIEWLFDGQNRELEVLVSAKALQELEIGESLRVRVSMLAEQYGEKKTITRSFVANKESANRCVTSNYMVEGIEENNRGERNIVDGKTLLDRIFPFQIRKYSLFKGEAQLNIFESDVALSNLIGLFSDAKHYEKYSEKGAFLKEKAEKAVEDSAKSDKKNEAQYKRLESEILRLENERRGYLVHLTSTDDEIRKIEGNLQIAEAHVNNAEALQTINSRIRGIEDKIKSLANNIDENYTTSLFDEKWITVNFEPIHHIFADKVKYLSLERRTQQSEFDRQKGIKDGERRAKSELLNRTVPLPLGIPSKAHMEEMLRDEICKVCNREASKGSPEYTFMLKRLEEYLQSQTEKEDTDERITLFKNDYTNRLVNLSISHEDNLKGLREIRKKIEEIFEFNGDRKREIEEQQEKLEVEKLERERVLGNSNIAEEKLTDVLKNYNAWQRDLRQRNTEQLAYRDKMKSIEAELKLKREEKDKIDLNSASSFLIKTRGILRDIETIFNDTKDKKFDEFITKLQAKSNNFFAAINVDAFTGAIVFIKKIKGSRTVVEIELQEDGRIFYKPNQSLLTSMHIAILFAISELASEIKEENFPMIFDAPTSSFGENKTAQFLNLIYETENQKILLIKDFLHTEKLTKTLIIKKEFEQVKRDKAFWVKLARPFDPFNLKTINTEVISL